MQALLRGLHQVSCDYRDCMEGVVLGLLAVMRKAGLAREVVGACPCTPWCVDFTKVLVIIENA